MFIQNLQPYSATNPAETSKPKMVKSSMAFVSPAVVLTAVAAGSVTGVAWASGWPDEYTRIFSSGFCCAFCEGYFAFTE
jgi:hypothetical protein